MEDTCQFCHVSPPKSYHSRGKYTCKPCKYTFKDPSELQIQSVTGGGEFASPATTAMGTQAEQNFLRFCSSHKNIKIRKATKYENMVLHYDFVVNVKDHKYHRVEVKAIKSRRRGLPPDPRVIFVELKDIHGNPGWLYGKADLIAFQQIDGFLLVPREFLVKRVETLKPTFRLSLQSGVHHTLYSRPQRNDLMMVLDIDDIDDICVDII